MRASPELPNGFMAEQAERFRSTTYVGFCQRPDGTTETISYRPADRDKVEEEPFGGKGWTLQDVSNNGEEQASQLPVTAEVVMAGAAPYAQDQVMEEVE